MEYIYCGYETETFGCMQPAVIAFGNDGEPVSTDDIRCGLHPVKNADWALPLDSIQHNL